MTGGTPRAAEDGRGASGEGRVIEGIVVAALPSALYRVEVEGRHRITAHIGGGSGKNFVRILVGDRVAIELTQKDLTRGRIVRKL